MKNKITWHGLWAYSCLVPMKVSSSGVLFYIGYMYILTHTYTSIGHFLLFFDIEVTYWNSVLYEIIQNQIKRHLLTRYILKSGLSLVFLNPHTFGSLNWKKNLVCVIFVCKAYAFMNNSWDWLRTQLNEETADLLPDSLLPTIFGLFFFFLRPFLQGFKKRHTLVIPFRSINCLWNPLFKMIIFVVTFKVGILILLD